MNKFVFVVCGGKEHIAELNFSLKFLRHFTKNEIIVLTDTKRNEIIIEHDNIIEVDTPKEYDNHQASIYIKTGINKFLSSGHTYCYLDGDIVAISENTDKIFDYFISPISFAKDHCTINQFSPFAMNCNCAEDNLKREKYFKESISKVFGKIDMSVFSDNKDSKKLLAIFNKLKEHPLKNFFSTIRYVFLRYIIPVNSFNLDIYRFDKKDKCWYNSNNEIILFDYPFYSKKLFELAGIWYDKQKNVWKSNDNQEFRFTEPSCIHLTEYLAKEYGISIPSDWQHWNGGVFIFDDTSTDFLNFWHEQTIKEFTNSYTKTRDQGTLALTVWKMGLQNQPNIPQEFNWITEYANNEIAWSKELGYTKDGFRTQFHPNLLHIYHEWGNQEWSIWNSLNSDHSIK